MAKRVDPEVFKRRAEESKTRRSGGGDYWKPQVGTVGVPKRNIIRILPPHDNMEDVFVDTKVHFSLGPNRDVAVGCLKAWGEECPACSDVDRLFKEAKTETDPSAAAKIKADAKRMVARLRFFANIVDILHMENGVQTYAFGPDTEKRLRTVFFDDEGDFRDVSDVRTGRDIIISVSKKQGQEEMNQYDEIRAKETPSPLADMGWVDQIRDLTELAKKPSREDVLNALKGIKKSGNDAPAQAPAQTKEKVVGDAKVKKPSPIQAPKSVTAPARQPVSREPVRAEPSLPYAKAREMCSDAGFDSPEDISPEEVERENKPPCWTKLPDPKDEACQECRLLLACLTAKHNLAA